MSRIALVGLLALVVANPAIGQNLLVNPSFDDPDQISGWSCDTTYGTAGWSPLDRLGSPTSGSMEHEVSAQSDNRKVRCWQCVPVDEELDYVASAWHFWPDDPDVFQEGTTRISFGFYDDADCLTSLDVWEIAVGHPILDTWVLLRSNELVAPADAESAIVYVFTWQDFADQPVRARLDDVAFFPVSIFRDGFDDGDWGAWSTAVP